jgi:hypothetical protein
VSLEDPDVILARFRPWLYAAATYNFLWGTSVILFPDWAFHLIRFPPPESPPFWQVVGMFVLVYAPAYAWAGRRPSGHAHIVMVGMLGKLLGPVGFLWALSVDELPLRFGLLLVTNDLIWWPSFVAYLRAAARLHGGWRPFLLGD